MKKIRILMIFLFLIVISFTTVNAQTPEVTATSAIVINCIDGKILYSKNIDEKLYPASLTNLLTAIIVVENCNMQDEVVVSKNAIKNVEFGYLTANIKEGEKLTVEQLLNLLLISSYCDASNALVEHIAGSTEEFAVMMNNKAREIGCKNSNFVNSTGEHTKEQYSAAYDMALIAKYAMQYTEIKEALGKIEYVLNPTEVWPDSNRKYYTSSEMLLSGSNNYYKYAKGTKISFTTPAGYCIMAYSEKNDMPLVAVVMKSTTSSSRYQDAEKILEYSYKTNMLRTIATKGTNMQTLEIKKGTEDTKRLNAILENNIQAVVKIENESTNINPQITIYENLKAPIEKGEVIGNVSYEIEGKTYTGNLIAETTVEKSHTVLILIITFLGTIVIIAGSRILGLYKRTKILKKIRGKQ